MKFLSCIELFLSFWLWMASAHANSSIRTEVEPATGFAQLSVVLTGHQEGYLFSGKCTSDFALFNYNQQTHAGSSGAGLIHSLPVFSAISYKALKQQSAGLWIWLRLKAMMLFPVHYFW